MIELFCYSILFNHKSFAMLEKLDKLSGRILDGFTSKQVTFLFIASLVLCFILGCVGYAIMHII